MNILAILIFFSAIADPGAVRFVIANSNQLLKSLMPVGDTTNDNPGTIPDLLTDLLESSDSETVLNAAGTIGGLVCVRPFSDHFFIRQPQMKDVTG